MQSVRMIPLFLILLVAPLLGLVAWGFWRARSQEISGVPVGWRDDVLLGLLLLAGLALVIFLSYVVLGLH